jgi:dihydrofolate reductase
MRKLILKTLISLDGFLEGPDGAMDWFMTDSDEWVEEFQLYKEVDTVLLGSGMYPGYSSYWRSALAEPAKHMKEEVEYARWAERTRHVVFSSTMQRVDWANTEIMRDAAGDVARLKRESGKNLIVFGGARFIGTLINLKLIDEYHLVLKPVALGRGKPWINDLQKQLVLKRIAVKPLASGTMWLTYTP